MIDLESVSFTYGESNKGQISQIDLSIKKGEFILLCGKSACGKTTITKCINGLIPHFLEGDYKGNVKIENNEIKELSMYQIAERVGSVFQNPKTQFFNLDSDSELVFGLENNGIDSERIQNRIDQVVKELDIGNLLHRKVFELSGGEKQALAIASIYATNPDVYVLDEPTANIDKDEVALLRKVLIKLKNEEKTIIIAEHRLYFLLDLIDKAVFVENGVIKKIYTQQEFSSITDYERRRMGLRAFENESAIVDVLNPKLDLPQLEIINLSIMRKKNILLKNINMAAYSGDIIAITGRNGVGKSTFMRCLCGLMKQRDGKINFLGCNYRYRRRRELCYMVMQDVVHQLFTDSVEEECRQLNSKINEEDVVSLLKSLDLYAFKDKHPMALSGGQKQRLAIAVAALSEKEIIILDEPTSGLDYDNMYRVGEIIKKLSPKHIIFIITHDEELIKLVCNRKIELEDGKILEDVYITNELGT